MRILVSTSSSVPIYAQIVAQARSAILAGDLSAGSTLPSLRHLAAELRVSVITITRAYNELVAEGLVRNEHGRGFVVLELDAVAADAALQQTVDDTLRAVVTAAIHARLPLPELHARLDQIWRNDA